MSVTDKWGALQNVQMGQILLDSIMKKDGRVPLALESDCKFTLLAVPGAYELLLVLLDRDRREYI